MAKSLPRQILSEINSAVWNGVGHVAGYGAAMGTGAVMGGYATAQLTDNATPGMVGGAIAGGSLALGGELFVRNIDKVGKGIGKAGIKAGMGIGKKMGEASAYLSSDLFADKATAAVMSAKRHAGYALKGAGNVAGVGASAAMKGGMKYGNIVGKMFKASDKEGQLFKLSGFGKTAVVGSAVVSGGMKAFQTFNDSRRGVSDGQITTATPQTPVYSSMMRDAGATGDLNFAMHATRRG